VLLSSWTPSTPAGIPDCCTPTPTHYHCHLDCDLNKAGETLTITLHEVHHDSSHDLGEDPGLQKDGAQGRDKYCSLNTSTHLVMDGR
jgi:RecB family endonuclease NucS